MPSDLLPPILYKYISWDNVYCRKILLENRIFFSSASLFNDPFDCSLVINYEDLDDAQLVEEYKKYLLAEIPKKSNDEIEALLKEFTSAKLYKRHDFITLIRNRQEDVMFNDIGIFCLSKVNDNLLMWSHYSNSHKGACIGFNVEKMLNYFKTELKLKAYSITPVEIDYNENYPKITILDSDESIGIRMLTSKAKNWKYEEEWRFILAGRTNYEVVIPNNVISEIILGCKMPREQRITIIEHLRNINQPIKLYDAIKSSSDYKLEIIENGYILD